MNNLLMLFICVPILAFILLFLNFLFSVHRTDFQIQFYIVAMLFLIFDLEILLLFPIAVTLYKVSTFGFSIALIFFVVLTIGFILEIGSGAISITTQNNNNK